MKEDKILLLVGICLAISIALNLIIIHTIL